MKYQEIKGLMLLLPTLSIGLWEYARHTVLLPYLSMEMGNLLAPVIVFVLTVPIMRKLFALMETTQMELNREKADKVTLIEREKLARELHDGIAQSLFLLSVKADLLERAEGKDTAAQVRSIRQTTHEVNEYVRQAIASLRIAPTADAPPWIQSIQQLINDIKSESRLKIRFDWHLNEQHLTGKEQIELYATVREALLNVRKHARAAHVDIRSGLLGDRGWFCTIMDDGIGFASDPFEVTGKYGLKIMRERAEEMGWMLSLLRIDDMTKLEIRKEDSQHAAVSRSNRR